MSEEKENLRAGLGFVMFMGGGIIFAAVGGGIGFWIGEGKSETTQFITTSVGSLTGLFKYISAHKSASKRD